MSEVMAANRLFDLSGEVALVTGASSGLGWRFAEVLAAHGASVVLAARRMERLQDLKARIAGRGGKAETVALDVAEPDRIAQAFEAAERAFGTVSLLVNNAGVSGGKRALDMSHEDWRRVLSINLDGVWFVAQETARRLVAAGKPGTIVNIASLLAFRVSPTLSAYSVAKAGVVQLTAALAVELARHHIRVNAIAPGYISTEMNQEFFAGPKGEALIKTIPQRRIGQPADLDGALLLLASTRASGFMTGSTIIVDGGQMLAIG
jgi:3-oxoacyl-[acyl-carrier protein] reductase